VPARTAIKIATTALTVAVAGSVLAGCHVGVGALQKHRTKSYPVAARLRTLVVNAHVGSVKVTGGTPAAVSVTEHMTFRNAVPVTTHRVSGGTLTLGSTCPDSDPCSVGYDITVPRSLTLKINDGVGTITLRSLSGRITAHTNAGDVDLGSVSGTIAVSSHVGSVHGQHVTSARATMSSSVGSVDAAFAATPAKITATTSVGPVTLHVPGTVRYAVHASASVGTTHVNVRRSPSSQHTITASTRTGSVTIDAAS
jgi:hypothetical protein